MSLLTRIRNVFRGARLRGELDEELRSHLEEAAELGRDRDEARRALGSYARLREESQDLKVVAWLENLRADAAFGWRQLWKNKVASAAAILSLGLAIGACAASFRLIDALLLRPLPVAHPERLYFLTSQYTDETGKKDYSDSSNYPLFRALRATLKEGEAELLAIGYAARQDLTYSTDAEMEKASRQYVSGWTFHSFGLRPALGRLLTPQDDVKPGAHAVAVLSYDYWQRRFGGDRKALGQTFKMDKYTYEIVGIAAEGFAGTETGTPTDIFLPTMMNERAINEAGWNWFRTWLILSPEANLDSILARFAATVRHQREERIQSWPPGAPKHRLDDYLNVVLAARPASAGVSGAQKQYRQSLGILAALVGLVLLIACVNVANLMTAQAASRAREMALRVSIGAGRFRLIQLVLVESCLVALASSVLGALFAAWAAPEVMSRINPPSNPLRLSLPADERLFAFLVLLALGVTILFGLVPALRASKVQPAAALKGGEDPHAKRRLMHALVAAQVAFCFIVHFVAGLFFATYDRLVAQPLGFAPERVLVLATGSRADQPAAHWDQVRAHLGALPGVESAALAGWGLMSGSGWNGDVYVAGKAPEQVPPYFLAVSPRWLETMKIPLLAGRDFRDEDRQPGKAIVNETFARRYFNGENPVGRSFERFEGKERVRVEIVGYVKDARHRGLRSVEPGVAYFPFFSNDEKGQSKSAAWGTFLVRTQAENPIALAAMLRKEIPRVRPEFRVSNVVTQQEQVDMHTLRERLLALLGGFFAAVALILAAVGLYGVLDYSVLQRRRELGIRLALGAQPANLVWRVAGEIFGMLLLGSVAGLLLGLASEKYLETLLFGVKARDWQMLAAPLATIGIASVVAALPPVLRAMRIDPAKMLRAE